MSHSLETEISREIQALLETTRLKIHYQPILSLSDGKILGYEALTRGPSGSPWRSPTRLFQAAAAVGMLAPLEYHVRNLAVIQFEWDAGEHLLFLNAHPAVPFLPADSAGSRECSIRRAITEHPHRLVVEFVEEDMMQTYLGMETSIAFLRAHRVGICLDDFGSRFAGLQPLVTFKPGWLKLNRWLISGIESDPWRQAVVRKLVELGESLGIQIIAEGVETQGELARIRALGVLAAQGYLLGLPAPLPGDH